MIVTYRQVLGFLHRKKNISRYCCVKTYLLYVLEAFKGEKRIPEGRMRRAAAVFWSQARGVCRKTSPTAGILFS